MPSNLRPRVLLADDHVGMLKAWGRLLERSCDVVGSVRDGRALIEAAIALKPDVIVADLARPEVSGLDVCRTVKASLPQTKFVLVTAGGDENVARAAFRAGASAFVLKHAAAYDLHVAIERALTGKAYCTPTMRMKSVESTG